MLRKKVGETIEWRAEASGTEGPTGELHVMSGTVKRELADGRLEVQGEDDRLHVVRLAWVEESDREVVERRRDALDALATDGELREIVADIVNFRQPEQRAKQYGEAAKRYHRYLQSLPEEAPAPKRCVHLADGATPFAGAVPCSECGLWAVDDDGEFTHEEGVDDLRCPDGLSNDAMEALGLIVATASDDRELPHCGGCRAFYSPKEWKERGEAHGLDAALIVVFDGGDLAHYFNPSYESGALLSKMHKALVAMGFRYELCTHWYAAVYPRG